MKYIFRLVILISLSMGLTGCIVVSSTSSSSATSEKKTQEENIKHLLTHEWGLQKVYREANSTVLEERNGNGLKQWMRFETSGRLYQAGFLGYTADQSVYWYLNGNMITIKGKNLTLGDGNLSGTTVQYKVEQVTNTNLHLSRPDGKTQNGSLITRHLLLTLKN